MKRRIAMLTMGLGVALVVTSGTWAAESVATLDDALAAYYDAEFETATDVLGRYLDRADLDSESRAEGLLYLAKVQWARSSESGARAALEEIRAFMPDYRPEMRKVLDIKNLYFDVFGAALSREPGIHTIAIVDFTNDSFGKDKEELEGMGRGIAHLLIAELGHALNVRVVERERLDYLLKEHELSKSDLVDPETAVQAGKLLGAQSFLMGGYMKIGDRMQMYPRLVVTETGEIKPLSRGRIEGDFDDLAELIDDLARALVEDVGGVLEGETDRSGAPGIDALKRYVDGLERLDRGDLDGAAMAFQAALDAHPQYEEAEAYLIEIQPLVAMADTDQ